MNCVADHRLSVDSVDRQRASNGCAPRNPAFNRPRHQRESRHAEGKFGGQTRKSPPDARRLVPLIVSRKVGARTSCAAAAECLTSMIDVSRAGGSPALETREIKFCKRICSLRLPMHSGAWMPRTI